MENSEDLIDELAAIITQHILYIIYEKASKKCDCEECCPKSPPGLVIPDCSDLVNEVLRKADVYRLVPTPLKLLPNTVIIFEGPFAGSFGIIYKEQCKTCSCCVLVQTILGVVKVNKNHCRIHA
jgi:hypothetical protein